MAKPFLEAKTTNKVKFVYSDDPNTNKIMDELFDMEVVEAAFGGKDEQDFDINKYTERMREDDKKLPILWKTPPPPADLDGTNSASDSEASDTKISPVLT